jgi:hypothetical protein
LRTPPASVRFLQAIERSNVFPFPPAAANKQRATEQLPEQSFVKSHGDSTPDETGQQLR